MKKVCVFCGNTPQDKNKEHIIPKWLMKLTNTENKNMSVGTNWQTGKELTFNFSAFTFPSCTKCNDDFAKVEALVKPTVERILNDEHVGKDELIRLLDWFDKVRISLWLGIQYLSKGAFSLEPKYYINTRVGLKDRMLAVTNCNDKYTGLRWTGANTLCFIFSPTCFTIKVNNILFTNCSSDFVVSKQLGFPYPIFERINPNSPLTDFQLVSGSNKVSNKLFKSKLYPPTTIISQPLYGIAKGLMESYYNNDYVKSNSYNYAKGEGKIFVSHNNITYTMEEDEEICFSNGGNKHALIHKFNKPTLEFQLELFLQKKYNLELLSKDEKDAHNQGLKLIIDYTKEQIKQYDY